MKNVLARYGLANAANITHIHRNAWSVDDAYILKASEDKGEFDKSISVARLLLSEGIPATEYLNTTDDAPYVFYDGKYWCLMKRIHGTVFAPFDGDLRRNGIVLGKAVARLHIALGNIENNVDTYDADFHKELLSWIIPELDKAGVSFTDGVIDSLHVFFEHDYESLPRQLIHRDIHTSNLLFENGEITGYLDFDMGQRNVRVFDVVYLACSQLVENYKDAARFIKWREVYSGILQGYCELLPLNGDEVKAMPSLFLFDQVLFTAYYCKVGDTGNAMNCVDMTNWVYKNIGYIATSG